MFKDPATSYNRRFSVANPAAPIKDGDFIRLNQNLARREGTIWHDMILAAGLSDIGCKRSANEDRILVDTVMNVFVVADGMGGERCGGHAAELATRAVEEFFRSPAAEINNQQLSEPDGLEATQKRMATAIRLANERVLRESINTEECRGMGCTLTVVTISAGLATVGSVGDSRAYLLKGKQLVQLTRDDSVLARLLAAGAITPEETRSHPMRNLLTQSVGTKETLDIQIIEFPLSTGDRLLLSSDGLHAIIGDKAIRETLAETHDPGATARELIASARQSGGPDNISCVVVDYSQ
jgi:protein phosphatase